MRGSTLYGLKADYYTNLVEGGGCTIQKDVLIKESALNEVVRYFRIQVVCKWVCFFNSCTMDDSRSVPSGGYL